MPSFIGLISIEVPLVTFNKKETLMKNKFSPEMIKAHNIVDETTNTRVDIAREFIALHKNSDETMWFIGGNVFTAGDTKANLESIFNNLENDLYGNVTRISEPYAKVAEYEVEIGSYHSATGNPVLFTWTDPTD